MSRKTYHWLLTIFAVWVALCIATVLQTAMQLWHKGLEIPVAALLLPMGYILLPVSAFGLWNLQRWGIITATIALILVLCSYPIGAILHVLTLVITAIHYYDGAGESGESH